MNTATLTTDQLYPINWEQALTACTGDCPLNNNSLYILKAERIEPENAD